MTKNKQFELALQLRKGGLSFSKVAKIVSEVAKRPTVYATSTMCGWCKHDNYDTYCKAQVAKQTRLVAERAAKKEAQKQEQTAKQDEAVKQYAGVVTGNKVADEPVKITDDINAKLILVEDKLAEAYVIIKKIRS